MLFLTCLLCMVIFKRILKFNDIINYDVVDNKQDIVAAYDYDDNDY